MENKNEGFSYTYSAKQQEEIRRIREKYEPKTESKMEYLRRLDKSAEYPGMIMSMTLGIIGSLLLGIGLSCTTEWTEFFVQGIAVGVVGIILIIIAYPVYKKITAKRRADIASEIFRLTDELTVQN